MAARWDEPLGGEGARIHGGRFNPPDSFPVIYLRTTRPCVVAEFLRSGARLVIGPEGLLPRVVYRYHVDLDRVLDLTDHETLDHVGAMTSELLAPDLTVPRRIGVDAREAGFQAIRAPSATGIDHVLAIFPKAVERGRLAPQLVERWDSLDHLSDEGRRRGG